MSGNTSSPPNGRSLGYIAPVSADGVTAVNTVVNVYVDSFSGATYTPTTAAQPAPVNFEQSAGITDAFKKSYQYVPTVPTASGKYGFDSLTPPTSSTSTLYQTIGSPVKLTNDGTTNATAVKYMDVINAVPSFNSKASVTSENKNNLPIPLPPADPKGYQWNLPPHSWSMPTIAYNNLPDKAYKNPSSDAYRRGRIWWKASANLSTVDGKGNTAKVDSSDRKYGFQFLWNPASFGTSVSVQMDATPNVNDQWLGGVGFFPSTENISFTLEINRINDFACANALFGRPTSLGTSLGSTKSNNFITPSDTASLVNYYKTNGGFSSVSSSNTKTKAVEDKLVDLFQRGTLADIEFLYKAINGPGPGSSSSGGDFWKNSRGIITADIGFLMPTLLNIDVGPLSYVGYVTAMAVNHTMFTQDMIPTQSTVQLSFNLLATAGVATTNIGG